MSDRTILKLEIIEHIPDWGDGLTGPPSYEIMTSITYGTPMADIGVICGALTNFISGNLFSRVSVYQSEFPPEVVRTGSDTEESEEFGAEVADDLEGPPEPEGYEVDIEIIEGGQIAFRRSHGLE